VSVGARRKTALYSVQATSRPREATSRRDSVPPNSYTPSASTGQMTKPVT